MSFMSIPRDRILAQQLATKTGDPNLYGQIYSNLRKGIGTPNFQAGKSYAMQPYSPSAGAGASAGAQAGGGMLSGVKGLYGQLSKAAPWLYGGISGLQGLSSLGELSSSGNDYDSLKGDVLSSYASNPLATEMLSSDDINAVNKLKRGGSLDGGADGAGFLKGITSNALGNGIGLAMGVANPLMLPGALLGLGASGISGMNEEKQGDVADLESLFARLQEAQQNYKRSKLPNTSGIAMRNDWQNYI